MKAQTIEELAKSLRDDLAWRRKENSTFRSAVKGADGPKKQAMLRGAVASLYAHWEGFVKTACRNYLDFVRIRRLRHHELSISFLGLALRERLRSVNSTTPLDSHGEFASWLLNERTGRAKLPKPNDVIGTSNLNSRVFKSFIKALGLPYHGDFERAEKPVIDVLLDRRNNLAHGEFLVVDESEYNEWLKCIDGLMRLLCELVEEAVATQAYRSDLSQLS